MTKPGRGGEPTIVDVAVIGAGPAGMIAALESAKLGLHVRLYADPGQPSGALQTGALGPVAGIDLAAESFSADGFTAKLAADLGVAVEPLGNRRTRLRTARAAGILPIGFRAGIAANPFDPALRPLLRRGLLRTYADRVMPYLQIGEEPNLGRLVRARLGDRFLSSVTRPFLGALWSLDPDQVSVDRAIPGLNAALTRLGSLQGAVASLERTERSDVRTVGGAGALAAALRVQLENYAVEIHNERVGSVEAAGDYWLLNGTETGVLRSRTVVIACDPAGLGFARPESQVPLAGERLMVHALVRLGAPLAPEEPSGVLRSEGPLRSLVRVAARSAALADQLEPGVELLRASIDSELLSDTALNDDETAESLLAEVFSEEFASETQLLELHTERWPMVRPWVALGDPAPGSRQGSADGSMEIAGAWAAGPGLDAAFRNGHDVAHRVRRVALARRSSADHADT